MKKLLTAIHCIVLRTLIYVSVAVIYTHCVSKKFTIFIFVITRCRPIIIMFSNIAPEKICKHVIYSFLIDYSI